MIHLDLRNLTPLHFDIAEAYDTGVCAYTSPCIIGTLMTKEQRESLSEKHNTLPIENLRGIVFWPDAEQEQDAALLQEAFDERTDNEYPDAMQDYEDERARILAKYGAGTKKEIVQ